MNIGRIKQIFHEIGSARSRVYVVGDNRTFFEGRPSQLYDDGVFSFIQEDAARVWISSVHVVAIEKLNS